MVKQDTERDPFSGARVERGNRVELEIGNGWLEADMGSNQRDHFEGAGVVSELFLRGEMRHFDSPIPETGKSEPAEIGGQRIPDRQNKKLLYHRGESVSSHIKRKKTDLLDVCVVFLVNFNRA